MINKKLAIIVGAVVTAVIVVLVGLSFIGKDDGDNNATSKGSDLNIDSLISDADKSEIKGLAQDFIREMGNFGWYPELIKNPQSVTAADPMTLLDEEHTTADELRTELRALTNTDRFDDVIDGSVVSVPVTVSSQITEEIVVPDKPVSLGSRSLITVTFPVDSEMSYIAQTQGALDGNNVFHPSETYVMTMKFKGDVNLSFTKESGQWYIADFSDTVGSLAVDGFSGLNEGMVLNQEPYESSQVRVEDIKQATDE